MISMNSYKKENGQIDWPAYKQAQIAAGEKCSKCGCYIFSFNSLLPGPRMCKPCTALYEDEDEIYHKDRIRCPKCESIWKVCDMEDESYYEEGQHKVSCCNCEHQFTIDTLVEFSFMSPEKLKKHQD